ncbi:MAG: methyltransferase domain-containing protein [Proteobacteria bacterium]|nr:methyltransferase domain-containing protein [Pseudomonadota bacterium]
MPDYYDTDTQLNEYLVFHYGEGAQVLGWEFGPVKALGFHKRLVGWIDTGRLRPGSRALDLGCAVGRITFELSKFCDSVVGIDASKSFITCADLIKASGTASFRLTREGSLGTPAEVQLPADLARDRVTFLQGDAADPPASVGKFDVVILANLLDRLAHPRKMLQKLPEIPRPGAQSFALGSQILDDRFDLGNPILNHVRRGCIPLAHIVHRRIPKVLRCFVLISPTV